MADGVSPDAHDWSFPMVKRATSGERGPKGSKLKGPDLRLVGSNPKPQRMSVSLDADVESHIGGRLRAMYDSVLREPVPDRFLDLLRQLDTKTLPEDGATAKSAPKRGDR
ncbi:MAG TPA: NepR family anti-sigma factor [Aliidongia sp.]|nr:NepR family anti-sigma factor [Aliidongia sp.]